MTTRATMAQQLSLSPNAATKTYVVETHVSDPTAALTELAGHPGRVQPTEDAFLFKVNTEAGSFWVDQLDGRFWSFHTDMRGRDAYPMLQHWVSASRDLDWMWLPSEHLRNLWPGAVSRRVRTDFRGGGFLDAGDPAHDLGVRLTGSNAERLLDLISAFPDYRAAVSFDAVEADLEDAAFGAVREGVNRMGRFAVSGDSLELHLQFVGAMVRRYKNFVTLCEAKAIKWDGGNQGHGGGLVSGGPIVVSFSREIADLDSFVQELTSSREPFRIWGVTSKTHAGYEVEAVDLHVGHTLQFDIGPTWLRIYLHDACCGNTVARLISNLQHRFDGALKLADLELDAAMRPTALANA